MTQVLLTESEIISKVKQHDPRDIIIITDMDLSWSRKHRNNFHDASLSRRRYELLCTLARNFGGFAVLTARGSASTFENLFAHELDPSLWPRMTIATNCGAILHSPQESHGRPVLNSRVALDLPNLPTKDLLAAGKKIADFIKNIGEQAECRAKLIIDPREYMGAIVYQDLTPLEQRQLHDLVMSNKAGLDGSSLKLKFAAKDVKIKKASGEVLHQGYYDIAPEGLNKSHGTKHLVNEFLRGRDPTKVMVIVIGDSEPDYAMMKAAQEVAPNSTHVFLSVGDGLADSQKYPLVNHVCAEHPQIAKYISQSPSCQLVPNRNPQNIAIQTLYSLLRAVADAHQLPHAASPRTFRKFGHHHIPPQLVRGGK